ncbi:MAG: tripartite tricarboxylate transporter TctB family protein [Dichotomicrobium sp.]
MAPIWPWLQYKRVEIGIAVLLLVLGAFLVSESIELGAGWGASGPAPGFFPFSLSVLLILGTLGVFVHVYRNPDERPFFEVAQEVKDLLSVGLPIAAATALIPWLGIYLTTGLYLAFFMFWYGQFRWYSALTGGILFPFILWMLLREGFNISMPMSVFYRTNILPF